MDSGNEIHKHFWKVIGQPGARWYNGHAMARCLRCVAYTIVARDEGIGPCEHATSRDPDALQVFKMPTEFETCSGCGALMDGSECEYCGE